MVLCVSLFVVAGGATAALAHYVYEKGYVWEGGSGKCVDARTEISHGKNGGGYTKVWTHTVKPLRLGEYYKADCANDWGRPVNYLRVRNVLYKCGNKCEKSRDWYVCRAQSWKYNGQTTDVLVKATYWRRPCGKGAYGNMGGAFTYYDNAWRGGYLWSGSHGLT